MNIMVLAHEPTKIARMLADEDLIEAVEDATQLLCNPFPLGEAPLVPQELTHPNSLWVSSDFNNFKWLLEYAFASENEYRNRFNKKHEMYDVLRWVEDHSAMLDNFILEKELTMFPMTVPESFRPPLDDAEFHWNHTVENGTDVTYGKCEFHFLPIMLAYRRYYTSVQDSRHWTYYSKPEWLVSRQYENRYG